MNRPRLRPTRLGRHEHAAFAAGTALFAAHLADLTDLWSDPSAGGALVALAAPAAAVLAYPHIRRAGRAALAIVIGLLAFASGIAGPGLHAAFYGPSWTDVSGLGMVAGGAVLLVLGVRVLVKRAGDQPAVHGSRRAVRAGVTALAAPAFALLVVVPLALSLMVTHPPRAPLGSHDLGRDYEEVQFTADDGTKLSGWYVPSRNGSAVVLMHGSGGNRSRVAHHAKMLARNDYGVLLFDQRGHGASAGHGNMLGWNAAQDVDAAVDLLERTPGVEHIAADGISMGGEVLLAAAAKDRRIEALVTDGAENMNKDDNPLLFGALEAISGRERVDVGKTVAGIAPRPALLISAGRRGGESTSNAMFQRKIGPSATHWAIGDVTHTAGLREHPREYEQRVIGFLDRAL